MRICGSNSWPGHISIHAPREGGDAFQTDENSEPTISIHAPREGGDGKDIRDSIINSNFNPRPPRGGRRKSL